jgi:hypothetical protein
VFNTANWRGAAAFLRFHCGLNSVAFYFGCGGIGRFEIVWNEAAARKSCIFKFFLSGPHTVSCSWAADSWGNITRDRSDPERREARLASNCVGKEKDLRIIPGNRGKV